MAFTFLLMDGIGCLPRKNHAGHKISAGTALMGGQMLTFFCPNCWRRIAEDAQQCPHCGYDLRQTAALSYDEHLLRSLWHSVSEYRVVAARILGQHGAVIALPEFRRIIQTDHNYYLLREVLLALPKIDDPLSRILLEEAAQHPSKLVAQLARALLAEWKKPES
jgi:HEAT repeat protein